MFKVLKLLAAIGAINWGLVGAFNFNLVSYLLKNLPIIEQLVYSLVGIAGITIVLELFIKQENFLKDNI